MMTIQAAEKFPQNYQLEVTNPGGHSSRPGARQCHLPPGGGADQDQRLCLPGDGQRHHPHLFRQDGGASAAASWARPWRPSPRIPRTRRPPPRWPPIPTPTPSCTPPASATLLSAGHANNALPQRADANINCRIFPGTTPEQVRATLQEVVADPDIKVTHGRQAQRSAQGAAAAQPARSSARSKSWSPRCGPAFRWCPRCRPAPPTARS